MVASLSQGTRRHVCNVALSRSASAVCRSASPYAVSDFNEWCLLYQMRCKRDSPMSSHCQRCARLEFACVTPELGKVGRKKGSTGSSTQRTLRLLQAEIAQLKADKVPTTCMPENTSSAPDIYASSFGLPDIDAIGNPLDGNTTVDLVDIPISLPDSHLQPASPNNPSADLQTQAYIIPHTAALTYQPYNQHLYHPEVFNIREAEGNARSLYQPAETHSTVTLSSTSQSGTSIATPTTATILTSPAASLSDNAGNAHGPLGVLASAADTCVNKQTPSEWFRPPWLSDNTNLIALSRSLLDETNCKKVGSGHHSDDRAKAMAALLHSINVKTENTHGIGYFRHQPLLSQDNDPALDPVHLGLVDDCQVAPLFATFFEKLNPFLGILDPKLHTPSFVQSKSTILFTTVLSAAADFTDGLSGLSRRLHFHVDVRALLSDHTTI